MHLRGEIGFFEVPMIILRIHAMQHENFSNQSTQQPRVFVFTSAALNYLPKIRVLFSSLRYHHPNWNLQLLLAESLTDELDIETEPFDVIVPFTDLGIPNYHPWSFCHTLTELATAIKPFMLLSLLSQSNEADKIIYLDPDIAVFSPLHDVIAALESAAIVLTPHQTKPETDLDAVIDNEIGSLKHGVSNLGFLAIRNSPTAKQFANWWSQRCYFFCRADICNGLFTDQRWIDLVPGLFEDVKILHSSRLNLSTWNITTRELGRDANKGYLVDEEQLGFYHFTGFDSGAHRLMALKNGKGNPHLEDIIRWYEKQLKKNGSGSNAMWPLAHYSNGSEIQDRHRQLYRHRVDLQRAYPDPYDANGYLKWWSAHGEKSYVLYLKQRQDPHYYISPGYLDPALVSRQHHRLLKALRQIYLAPRSGKSVFHRCCRILLDQGLVTFIRRILR